MGVGIQLGRITDEIGSGAFLYAFFSTISGNRSRMAGEVDSQSS